MGNFRTYKITEYKIIWQTYFFLLGRAMRIINKTIRKSKIELKGGDGELG